LKEGETLFLANKIGEKFNKTAELRLSDRKIRKSFCLINEILPVEEGDG